jgi:hypothetical protein
MNILDAYLKFFGKIFIHIIGIPGSNKLQYTKELADNLNIKYIDINDYKTDFEPKLKLPNSKKSINNIFDPSTFDFNKLNEDINMFSSDGLILTSYGFSSSKLEIKPDINIMLDINKHFAMKSFISQNPQHDSKYINQLYNFYLFKFMDDLKVNEKLKIFINLKGNYDSEMDKLWEFIINYIDHKIYSNDYKKNIDATQTFVRIPNTREEKNISKYSKDQRSKIIHDIINPDKSKVIKPNCKDNCPLSDYSMSLSIKESDYPLESDDLGTHSLRKKFKEEYDLDIDEIDDLVNYKDEESQESNEDSQVSDEESQVSDEESQVSNEDSQESDEDSQESDEESQVSDEESQESDEESQVSDEESQVSDEESQESDEESQVSDEESQEYDEESQESNEEEKRKLAEKREIEQQKKIQREQQKKEKKLAAKREREQQKKEQKLAAKREREQQKKRQREQIREKNLAEKREREQQKKEQKLAAKREREQQKKREREQQIREKNLAEKREREQQKKEQKLAAKREREQQKKREREQHKKEKKLAEKREREQQKKRETDKNTDTDTDIYTDTGTKTKTENIETENTESDDKVDEILSSWQSGGSKSIIKTINIE